MHIHFRQDDMLGAVVPYTARRCHYAVVMPNTIPPIATGEDAEVYYAQIMQAASSANFKPLVAIKMFDDGPLFTSPEVVRHAYEKGVRVMKVYPAGMTTHANDGVKDFTKLYPALAEAEEKNITVCWHGEIAGYILEREINFLKSFKDVVKEFPKLRNVMEHVSTWQAVECIKNEMPDTVAATITPQHLCFTLDNLAGDMLEPDHFCKPLVKSPRDRAALQQVAFSGNRKFFYGSDSAPHLENKKYCAHGCAGVFSAPFALELLAELFADNEVSAENFQSFMSVNGPSFYELPLPEETMTLVEGEPWIAPDYYLVGTNKIRSAIAGRKMKWSLVK